MARGPDEHPEDGTIGVYSDAGPSKPGAIPEETVVPSSDTAAGFAGSSLVEAVAGDVGPSSSSMPEPARPPYATASAGGIAPSFSEESLAGKSFLDGPIVPGQILFGRFEVLRKIDDGGMGQVWLVRHIELDAERALKFILPRFSIHESVRVRFGREARVMARFGHPNIVVVHDASLSGDAAFIEMEFIRGQSLNKLMRPGVPMPLDWVGRILDQLCDALQVAHDNHVVHRDLKPSNLMLVDGRPAGKEFLKILDFGIAKILDYDNRDSGGNTMTDGFLGTVQYASPEQLMGQAVDGRSDIYSAGVMLYEMLTGFRPFGGTAMEQMHAHVYQEPPSPLVKHPEAGIPPGVAQAVLRCLAKDPAHRPQTPRELGDEFLRALAEAGVASVSPAISRSSVAHVVDPMAPTEPAEPDAAPTPGQESVDRTAIGFGSRMGSGSFVGGPPSGRSDGSYPALGPSGSSSLVLLEGPLTEERPKLKPAPRRVSWLPVATVLALLLVLTAVVVLVRRSALDEPKVPVPAGTSPEARTALLRWEVAGYRADPEAGVSDGWPKTLVRAADGARFWRYQGEIYLPEGYEPVNSQALAADGWPEALVRTRDKKQFNRIPGGTFSMGRVSKALGPTGEPVDPNAPERPMTLTGFYMQEFEVTNGEVEDWYKALGIPPAQQPEAWRQSFEDLSSDTNDETARIHPAVMISHRDAERFAKWAHGRLPTEAQWEYAARSGGKDHQWVAGIDPSKPMQGQANISILGREDLATSRGGAFQGDRTEQGVFDMMGNVREWCRDAWEPFAPLKDPTKPLEDFPGPPRGDGTDVQFVTRGGSSLSEVDRGLTIGIGNPQRVDHEGRDEVSYQVGFRLVLECPPPLSPAVPALAAR